MTFPQNNGFGILAATLLFVFAAEPTHSGEPLIFRDSNDKNSAPKEKFDLNAIRPNSPSFDKKSSSVVEGVIAPWQHPTSKPSQHKLTPQQRKRLLDALDRKKNWGMQDSAEMLNSDSPSANKDKLDAGPTKRNYNRSEESSFGKYSTNQNSKKQPNWKNSPFNNFNDDANPNNQTANEEEQLTFIDSFATAEDFEMRLDSIFDQPSPNEEGIQNQILFNSADDFLEFNEFQTPTETSEPNSLFSTNPEPNAQTRFSQPSQLNPLLSPPTALENNLTGQQLIPRNGLNLQNSSIAAPSAANLFNNGLFSNPTTELPTANNQSLPSTSAIQSPASPLGGNSSFVQPGELELLNRPAAPNLLKQPAIFQLPKRSF